MGLDITQHASSVAGCMSLASASWTTPGLKQWDGHSMVEESHTDADGVEMRGRFSLCYSHNFFINFYLKMVCYVTFWCYNMIQLYSPQNSQFHIMKKRIDTWGDGRGLIKMPLGKRGHPSPPHLTCGWRPCLLSNRFASNQQVVMALRKFPWATAVRYQHFCSNWLLLRGNFFEFVKFCNLQEFLFWFLY